MKKILSSLALLLTAVIWGFAFVAQSVGMDYVGAFTFQSTRSFLGAATLVPFILLSKRRKRKLGTARTSSTADKKQLLIGGVVCGILLTIASLFQQIGIMYTSVGKSGFITSMYLILVPILGVFLHKRVPAKIWGCVILAAVGLYFLSISGSFTLSRGDTLTIICAFGFALHILCVDHFVSHVDGVTLSFIQLFTSGVLSGILMLLFDHPTAASLQAALIPILYAGILSSGVAYTLQVIGQKYTSPTTATLLMSLESVFSVVGGILLLSQVPTVREFFGCALIFAAVVFSQIPAWGRKKVCETEHTEP